MISNEEVAGRFEQLNSGRSSAITRAEQAAKVTIPALFPEDGHSEVTDLKTPYQGLGARAVNTLAAKIMLALFPPNTAFFKISFDAVTRAQFEEDDSVDKAEIEKQLGLLEQVVVGELERTRMRPMMYLAVRYLLVAGNCVVRIDGEGKLKVFSLRSFVAQRDPEGTVTLLIIKESVAVETLPEQVVEECLGPEYEQSDDPTDDKVDAYTVQQLVDGKYKVKQVINDKTVPGSEATYPLKAPMLLALRWTAIPGEHYGRGMVDEYYGDFAALDDLSRDLLDCAANMARFIWLLDPNGYLNEQDLADAISGDVLSGRREEVSALTADKFPDLQYVLNRVASIEAHIKEAFLMHSSIQRDAERVTAEEVRFMATELENALGGVYSLLSHELQMPLTRRYISLLERQEKLPELPDDMEIALTTGIEALGRGHDVQKMLQFINSAKQAVGEENFAQLADGTAILKALQTGFGLANHNLIREREAVQGDQQRQMQERLAERVAPEVARGAMQTNQE